MADRADVSSLQQFAAAQPGPRRCVLCTVDPDIERQAREGKAAGIPYRVIGKWLSSILGEPAPVSKGRLERHFQDGHMNVADSKGTL